MITMILFNPECPACRRQGDIIETKTANERSMTPKESNVCSKKHPTKDYWPHRGHTFAE